MALSLLWILCSLPLVTLGAAATALYDSVSHCLRFGEPGPYKRFFGTFRRELKLSCLSTLIWGFLSGLALLILKYLRDMIPIFENAAAAFGAYYVALIIPLGAACWVFPILSRFSFDFKWLNTTALKFALAHLPSTLILVLLTVEIMRFSFKWVFPFAFSPALMMLLWSLFIEPVFKKHGGGLKKPVVEEEGKGESAEE